MKRFFFLCALLGVFGLAAMLLQPVDGQGVIILGVTDNLYKIGASNITDMAQRVIPSAGTLAGIDSKLSTITAPAAFTSGGTFRRIAGTARAGTATEIQLEASPDLADDALNGYTVYIIRGTGAHQQATITDYTGSTETATVASWPIATPDTTSMYIVTGGTPVTGDDAYVTTENYGVTSAVNTQVHSVGIYGGQTVTSSDDAISTTNAVEMDTFDGEVSNCVISGFRGTGVKLTRSAGSTTTRIVNNEIGVVHTGIETTQPDTRISENIIVGYRDYGIKINAGDTACMTHFNHTFGSGSPGVGYYVGAAECTSTHDKIDDSFIGVWIDGASPNCSFNNLFSQKCWHRNVLIQADKCAFTGGRISTIRDSDVHGGVIGIEIAADGTVLNGIMHDTNWVSYGGSTYHANDAAIRINDGADHTRITNYTIGAHSTLDTEVGIHLDGANIGTVIDVTVEEFEDGSGGTADVAVKVDDAANTKGCDITIREKLRLGDGESQNLITIGSGWTGRITLVQSDGTYTIYDDLHGTEGDAIP